MTFSSLIHRKLLFFLKISSIHIHAVTLLEEEEDLLLRIVAAPVLLPRV